MVITRGTTPLYTFHVPFKAEDIELIIVTLSQGAKSINFQNIPFAPITENKVNENGEEVLEEMTEFQIQFSQKQTLSLSDKKVALLQVTLKDVAGEVYKTNIREITVLPSLEGNEI